MEPLDVIVDGLSGLLVLGMIVFTFTSYSSLPEAIPTHFNASGEADGFGSKNTVWLLPALALIIYVILFILNKYPHLHNYMVNITEDNALKNYRFSTRLLRFVNLFTVALLTYIQYIVLRSSTGETVNLGGWFLPTIITVSIVAPAFLIYYNFRMNKNKLT